MHVHSSIRSILALFAFCASTAFAQTADLAITKSGPATAAANSDVAYSVFVSNDGPDAADTVTLSDPIPGTMTFVSLSQNSGPAFGCSLPPVGSSGTITCSIATLPSGSSASFTITLHIPSGTPPSTFFTNIVSIVTSTFDPNSENDSSTAATATPSNNADLSVTKTGPSSGGPNTDVTYTITVVNSGPAVASNVVLSDTLPGTMTFVSLTQISGPVFTCSSPPVGAGGSIACSIASLANGASASFALTGRIPTSTSTGAVFTNMATVTSTEDPTEENNTATAATVVSSVDLAVTKGGPATVNAGQSITYTITVANNGPDAATDVRFDDPFPFQTTFVSLVQNTGPAALCTSSSSAASCIFATLAPGASGTFTLTLLVSPAAAGGSTLINNVTATSDSFDSNSANNAASSSTSIIGLADLAVGINDNPDPVLAGANLTYTITVQNLGMQAALNSTLVDTLPGGTTFVSLTSGAGWTCTTPAVGVGGTVNCSNPSFAAGAASTFTLVAHVSGSLSSGTMLTNTATAATASSDASAANNTAVTTTTVAVLVVAPTSIPSLSLGALIALLSALAGLGLLRMRKGR